MDRIAIIEGIAVGLLAAAVSCAFGFAVREALELCFGMDTKVAGSLAVTAMWASHRVTQPAATAVVGQTVAAIAEARQDGAL